MLEDLYSLKKNLIPEYEEGTLEKLLMKNNTKCRVEERMEIPREEGNILQICSCSGKAAVENSRVTENGVEVEGTLQVQILFVTAEDASPIGAWETLLPFRQLIEADGITSDTRTELECCVEQLAAILLDGGNVEIKATVDLNLIAFFKQHIRILKEGEGRRTEPGCFAETAGNYRVYRKRGRFHVEYRKREPYDCAKYHRYERTEWNTDENRRNC